MEKKYIVFFDSGIGGLNVLGEFQRLCPGERCLYYGDNANAPYGGRTEEEILWLTLDAFAKITQYPVRAAVIGCNTVTAECVDVLRQKFTFPIVGIEPAVKPASAAARGGTVLLAATRATLSSIRVQKLIEANSREAKIVTYAPDDLARAVERTAPDFDEIDLSRHLPEGKFDAVVLGCTHYVFLKNQIQNYYGCPVFDGISGTADHLRKILNICSENCRKIDKIPPFFQGTDKNKNETVYNKVFFQ